MVDKIAYPVQLIQPDGRRVFRPDYTSLVRDIGPDQLRGLYEDLVVVRRMDVEAVALQRQGELGLWAPCSGRKPHRSLRPRPPPPTTTRSSATANTPSPTAGVWTRG